MLINKQKKRAKPSFQMLKSLLKVKLLRRSILNMVMHESVPLVICEKNR